MDANWDLDSLVELCSSKLIQDGGLHAFEDAGNLDWLDEKVDLSAWTQLDFPDDLTPVMLDASDFQAAIQPDQSSNCSSDLKAGGFVPNVDIFINFDAHHLHNAGASITGRADDTDTASSSNSLSPPLTPSYSGVPPASTVVEVPYAIASAPASPSYFAAYNSPAGSPVAISETVVATCASPVPSVEEEILGDIKSEPSSPSYLPASPVGSPIDCIVSVSSPVPSTSTCPSFSVADNADLRSPVEPSSPESCSSAPSPLPGPEQFAESPLPHASADREDHDGRDGGDDPMDADFAPEANGSDSESALDSAAEEPPRKRKRTVKRRPRAKADVSSRKERKRLQNKDAATRYRQKKKQQFGKVEEELEELTATNVSLQSEAQRIANEISYLKGLMRELFRAKGLIK
ncbi:hypothetical protein MTO96_021573 [Rhipicephalus appendiculatus]